MNVGRLRLDFIFIFITSRSKINAIILSPCGSKSGILIKFYDCVKFTEIPSILRTKCRGNNLINGNTQNVYIVIYAYAF